MPLGVSDPSMAPPALPPDEGPHSRDARKRPRARLRALDDGRPATEWASLAADLDRTHPPPDDPVEWRIHDKTHLEFAIDYPLAVRPADYEWEAYFFVPESFRLLAETYDKKAFYDDLLSYVRLAVPPTPFGVLARVETGRPLGDLARALAACSGRDAGSEPAITATRALRLFACYVRSSGIAAMREVQNAARSATPDAARPLAAGFVATCAAVAAALRGVLARADGTPGPPDDVRTAVRWTDEDVSLVLETLCANAGIELERHAHACPSLHEAAERLAARAVDEARHRSACGMDTVGAANASARAIEHLEFRRHVLKRFTASVLWLSTHVDERRHWVVQVPYAIAAAVAMTFAVAASRHVVPQLSADNVTRYTLAATIAYAVKDRLKALLQGAFADWVEKRFPDRAWSFRDEQGRDLGWVRERSGFLPFRRLPADVLAARRRTREHALEEHARPERVLWHEKRVVVPPASAVGAFPMVTEIFRLNIGPWLAHTDDPNRKIVFADPSDARIYAATARRVYNINVVYRLRRGERPAPWHRLRVVVSRKGIERIDPIQ